MIPALFDADIITNPSRHTSTPECGGGQQISYKVTYVLFVFNVATQALIVLKYYGGRALRTKRRSGKLQAAARSRYKVAKATHWMIFMNYLRKMKRKDFDEELLTLTLVERSRSTSACLWRILMNGKT